MKIKDLIKPEQKSDERVKAEMDIFLDQQGLDLRKRLIAAEANSRFYNLQYDDDKSQQALQEGTKFAKMVMNLRVQLKLLEELRKEVSSGKFLW